MMRKAIVFFWLVLAAAAAGFAEDFTALLKNADALVNFPESDFSAEYTIIREVPGEGLNTTECVIFRRDAARQYVIVITAPKINKGQGYLKMDETIWFYDPESRKFNSTSSRERFQNSIARNADFTRSTLAEDYAVAKGEKTKLGVYDCWLLDLKAARDGVTYPAGRLWVSTDGLVRKLENYSLSGQLLRTIAVSGYQKLGARFVPNKILILDNLKGKTENGRLVHEKIQITIAKPSQKALPDSVFSKTFLETMSK
jgi:hypothetical protein